MPPLYLLFESASGYCLFQNLGLDEVGSALAPDQQSLTDLERFSKVSSQKPYLDCASQAQQTKSTCCVPAYNLVVSVLLCDE